MQMPLTLKQIAYFVRLLERGSYTSAAESLGITQPALSIAISQLEKALETPLLNRGTSPPTVTEGGAIFLRYAQRIQRDLSEARAELAAHASGTIGRLEICMGPSAASPQVGSTLAEMVAEFPSLDVIIHNGVVPAINDRLLDGEYALYVGVVPDSCEDKRFEIVPLAMIDLIVVASPLHPLSRAAHVGAAELARAAWIVIGNVELNLPDWPARFLSAGVSPPRPAINVRNVALVRNLLDQGKLVTVLPKGMVEIDIAAGHLCAIAENEFTWRVQLSAMFPRGKQLSAGATILIEKLTRLFAAGSDKLPK